MRWKKEHRPGRDRRPRRWRRPAWRRALPVGGGLGVVGVIVSSRSSCSAAAAAGFHDPGWLRRGHAGAERASRSRPSQDPGARPQGLLRLRLQQRPVDVAAHVRASRAAATTGRSSCSTAEGVDTALRLGHLGRRPVLLPGGPARLPRPLASTATWSTSSGRAATSRGPTSSRTRSATTSSSSWARATEVDARPPRRSRPRERGVGAARAAGRLLRRRLGARVFDQLEPGDIDEAIRASEAVGDDRLQQQAGRRSTRTRSRTARPRSGSAGSSAGARAASRPTATRSPPRRL